jgi:hypothetical protein
MFEPSQYKTIGSEAEKQQETCQDLCVNPEPALGEVPSNQMNGSGHAGEPAQAVNEPVPANTIRGEMLNQHAEAGRKGAQRVHQLIQHGRQYEREHGLKPGRQRLRQLIQEGKLYEQEHGLKSESKRSRGARRPRVTQEQLLKTLLQALLRLAKPGYRSRIVDLVYALERENP